MSSSTGRKFHHAQDEIYHNPDWTVVDLWRIFGPKIITLLRKAGSSSYEFNRKEGVYITPENLEEVFHFTNEKLIALLPREYETLVKWCKTPATRQFAAPVQFRNRAMTASENFKFSRVCSDFELDFDGLGKIMESRKIGVSGSALLWSLESFSESKPWSPNDIDFYVSLKADIPALSNFLISQNYSRRKSPTNFFSRRTSDKLKYIQPESEFANLDYDFIGQNLIADVQRFRNKSGKIIQIIAPIGPHFNFHISQYFDFPCVKRYYDGENVYEHESIFNGDNFLDGTYLSLKFDIFEEQLSIDLDTFAESGKWWYQNQCRRAKNILNTHLKRAQKYSERGYLEYLAELMPVYERLNRLIQEKLTVLAPRPPGAWDHYLEDDEDYDAEDEDSYSDTGVQKDESAPYYSSD